MLELVGNISTAIVLAQVAAAIWFYPRLLRWRNIEMTVGARHLRTAAMTFANDPRDIPDSILRDVATMTKTAFLPNTPLIMAEAYWRADPAKESGISTDLDRLPDDLRSAYMRSVYAWSRIARNTSIRGWLAMRRAEIGYLTRLTSHLEATSQASGLSVTSPPKKSLGTYSENAAVPIAAIHKIEQAA